MSASAERELRDKLEEAGWLIVRAAGSLGGVDLVALRPRTAVDHGGVTVRLIEVKETGRRVRDRVGVFYPSTSDGEGEEQWNHLRALSWWGFRCCFAVRQKDRHLPEELPRWSIHTVRGEAHPLHQDKGVPLADTEFLNPPRRES